MYPFLFIYLCPLLWCLWLDLYEKQHLCYKCDRDFTAPLYKTAVGYVSATETESGSLS